MRVPRYFLKNNPSRRGFSLLEILLVIALMTVIVGIGTPALSRLFYRNNLNLDAENIKTDLYLAQTRAKAGENNSAWGVYLDGASSTIFSGTSYAFRDISFDETNFLSGTIASGSLNEIMFQEISGRPTASGTITLNLSGETENIKINGYGLIY
jgi:prepilin-type N-terminal cleavage/methylation domain-containing protein